MSTFQIPPANPRNHKTTVGILHCGDLGSALGRLLRHAGCRVITTCQHRSASTQRRARSSGVEMLPSFEEVVVESDFVVSLVLPTAAVEVAKQYVTFSEKRPPHSVFVEANSIGLETLQQIDQLMATQKIPWVDAAIHGGAQRLKEIGTLYVSGPDAHRVEQLFAGILRVTDLGGQRGAASRLKLLMAGISKIMSAMFLEMGALAERNGLWQPFWDNCQHFYPGTMSTIQRLLPTYPQHAERRVGEMLDIVQLAKASDLPAGLAHAAAEIIRRVGAVDWDHVESATDIATIIRAVAETCGPGCASLLTEAQKK